MKRTKIICTLGPSSHTRPILERMIHAGMNVARLNFSHGSHVDHAELMRLVRAAAQKTKTPIAILQDLQGPRIRIGTVPVEGVRVATGQKVVVVYERKKLKPSAKSVVIPIQVDVHTALRKGHHILIQDGTIDLRVVSVRGDAVHCVVVVPGTIYTHKGINLPGVKLSIPALTPKDKADARFGIAQGVDYVALSFVKDAQDIKSLRRVIGAHSSTRIIAKIERQEAVDNLDAIIEASDGIMIARGDLGVELGSAPVPVIQKECIERCIAAGKPVIVATQMLESMIHNARPTRAEASDVANAVFDQADALMLSGESASGQYPVEAVHTMARVARFTEKSEKRKVHDVLHSASSVWDSRDAVAHASVTLALEARATVLVVVGNDVDMLARVVRFRPQHIQCVGMTTNRAVVTQAQLLWGVQMILVQRLPSAKNAQLTPAMKKRLHEMSARPLKSAVVLPVHSRSTVLEAELITL